MLLILAILANGIKALILMPTIFLLIHMVVLDDIEKAKLNTHYFDLEAKTLNKVATKINSFTVFALIIIM